MCVYRDEQYAKRVWSCDNHENGYAQIDSKSYEDAQFRLVFSPYEFNSTN